MKKLKVNFKRTGKGKQITYQLKNLILQLRVEKAI